MSDDWAACRAIIARHSKSFALASRLYRQPLRDEVGALYAWCRTCDDAIDTAPAHRQSDALAELEEGLRQVYAGKPQADAIHRCFQAVVERRAIPVEYPLELLAGMRMDVEAIGYGTLDELLLYCWRVAGTVGLMMCHVMGVTDEHAATRAAHLGIAMQLTNICRDVAEDWRLGRVYIPAALLGEPLAGWMGKARLADPRPALPDGAEGAIASAVKQLLDEADRFYVSGEIGMKHLEPRSALAVRAAARIYAEIGREIERRNLDVLRGRAIVSTTRKMRILARVLARFAQERASQPRSPLIAPRRLIDASEAIRILGAEAE